MAVRSYYCHRVRADSQEEAASKALRAHPGAKVTVYKLFPEDDLDDWWEYIALLDEAGDVANEQGGNLAL